MNAACRRNGDCMGSRIDSQQEHTDGRQPLRLMLGIAVVMFALSALAVLVWSSRQVALLANLLSVSVAGDGAVWVASHDFLHRLDGQGERQLRVAPADIGLPLPLRHLHAIAANRLLVNAGKPSRLYRCDLERNACSLADSGYVEKFGAFYQSAWIAADAEGRRVAVVDNAAHRVAVLDESGQLLAADGGSIGRFHYPGQVVWAGTHYLWLAAGDRFRIERIAFDGVTIGTPSQEFLLPRDDSVVAGRHWPMALAPLPDGRWWVVVKRHFTKAGGLVLVDPAQGRVLASAALPEGADIAAVANAGQSLLLADLHGPALWRMSGDGKQISSFGDAAFTQELQDRETQRARAQRLVHWSQGLAIGLPLVGILLLLALGERQPMGSKKLQATGSAELAGLPLNLPLLPKVRRSLRVLAWMGLFTVLTSAVMFAFVLAPHWQALFASPTQATDKERWPAIFVALIMLAAIFVAVYVFRALMRESSATLTVEPLHLTLHHGDHLKTHAAWHDCRTDGRVLFIGLKMVALVWQRGTRFDEQVLQQRLLPMVPAPNWHSGFTLYRVMLNLYWQRVPLRVLAMGLLALSPVALEVARLYGVFRS